MLYVSLAHAVLAALLRVYSPSLEMTCLQPGAHPGCSCHVARPVAAFSSWMTVSGTFQSGEFSRGRCVGEQPLARAAIQREGQLVFRVGLLVPRCALWPVYAHKLMLVVLSEAGPHGVPNAVVAPQTHYIDLVDVPVAADFLLQ